MSSSRINIPKVSDIMKKKVIFLTVRTRLAEAIATFNQYRISSAPVINETKGIIGFVSDQDCIRSVENSLFYDEFKDETIDTIMTSKVDTISSYLDIFELEKFFEEKELRHAPVTDDDGHLLGIVSRRDVLIVLEELIKKTLEYKIELKKPLPTELTINERMKILSKGM